VSGPPSRSCPSPSGAPDDSYDAVDAARVSAYELSHHYQVSEARWRHDRGYVGSALVRQLLYAGAMRRHIPLVLVALALGLGSGCGSVSSTNDGGGGGGAAGSAGGHGGGVAGAGGGVAGQGGGAGGRAGNSGGGGKAGAGGGQAGSGGGGKAGAGGGQAGSGGGGKAGAGGGAAGGPGGGGSGGTAGLSGTVCGGLRGAQCSTAEWCDFGGNCGVADQSGVCQTRDATGFDCASPVCGCDGKTYSSACSAHQAGEDTMATPSCIPGNGGAGAPCGADTDCASGFKCCATGGAVGLPIACRQIPAGGLCPALP
jgi:hypothetical protein